MARRDPGLWLGGEKVLPAADPDELDEGLRLEVEYERAKEAIVACARALVNQQQPGARAALQVQLELALAAHDTAREAYRAHGGTVWHPEVRS